MPVATAALIKLTDRPSGEEEGEKKTPEQQLAELVEKLKQEPGDVVHPIPGQPTSLTKTELDSLSAEEIRHTIFERLAQSYYRRGFQGVAADQQASTEQLQIAEKQAGLLKFVNQETNTKIFQFFLIIALISLLPLIGLIYFSYRVGRLISPGLVLFFIPLPGALLSAAIASSPPHSQPADGPFAALPPEAATLIGRNLLPGFAVPCLIGLFLLFLAVIWGLILHFKKKREPSPATESKPIEHKKADSPE